jgi:phosphohistidine phosphatase SixA
MHEEQDEAVWPLTERGHEQAALAGKWIRENIGTTFDKAYVSPYIRTHQTAENRLT